MRPAFKHQKEPQEPPLTQSLLRSELDTFTRETLRRELEDLKASLVNEVVDRLIAREAEAKAKFEPIDEDPLDGGPSRQRMSPQLPTTAQYPEAGDQAAQQPLIGSAEDNDIQDECECLQSSALRECHQSYCFQRLSDFVRGSMFESVASFLVILSVAWLTFQTEYTARMWLSAAPREFIGVEIFFLVGFSIELSLRVMVFGIKGYFCGPDRYASWFDFGLVVITVLDVIQEIAVDSDSQAHWAPLLRLLRLVRILRLVRVFRFFPDLRMLIVSVMQSVQPLVWVFALISTVTAVFAILITVVVTDYKTRFTYDEWQQKEEHEQNLQDYFGTVERSILSLYGTIAGGRDWHASAEPLGKFISPQIVYVFVAYTFFVIFAMMNVITSQFVDQTLEASAQDRRESMVSNLMDAFSKTGGGGGMVSEDGFMSNLQHPSMKSFLKDLYKREDVSRDEIKKSRLFEMLDDDGSGQITREELVLGCVRLTGSATSLDLAVLKLDVECLRRDLETILKMHRAEGRLRKVPRTRTKETKS